MKIPKKLYANNLQFVLLYDIIYAKGILEKLSRRRASSFFEGCAESYYDGKPQEVLCQENQF